MIDSSEALVLFCTGASAFLGLLHYSLIRRWGDADSWVALWCALSCIFLTARGVQLTTTDPAAALLSGKVSLSIGPYLVWAIVGFGRSANGRALDSLGMRVLGSVSVLWTLAIVGTPWFVEPFVTTRSDFFGNSHLSVHARWPTLLLGAYFIGSLIWGLRRLRVEGHLDAVERRTLMFGFGVYTVLGVAAVLTSASLIPIPAMAEFGPVVVAGCLCRLMVRRRAQVERQLSTLLEERSSDLAMSQERYRALVTRAPIGIVACDASGEITAINPRMGELVKASLPSDGLDAPAISIDSLGLASMVRRVVSDGGVVRETLRMGSAEARVERCWQVTAAPVADDAVGAGVLVLVDDVTDRSRLEKQLLQAQKMDSIGQLAAGIAHEINNPMAFVRSNLAAMGALRLDLAEPQLDPEAKSEVLDELSALIDESCEGVERTISIVRDMREVAHAGEAATDSDAASGAYSTSLGDVLEACIRIASVSDARGVTIHSAPVGDLQVGLPAGPLRQVVLNLLINALQAVSEAGGVWVETRVGSASVVVSVHDDGPGVPESLRTRLFDPFFTTKAVGEGTGLGLYISYQIVRGYGGDLRVDDGPNGGARFEIELPKPRAARS